MKGEARAVPPKVAASQRGMMKKIALMMVVMLFVTNMAAMSFAQMA